MAASQIGRPMIDKLGFAYHLAWATRVCRLRPEILADLQPDVIFAAFGDSSLDFELRIWTTERLRAPQVLK